MAKKDQVLYNLGPWPNGQNTVQSPASNIFQLQDPNAMFKKENVGSLLRAINVNFDNDGWPLRRAGTSQVLAGTTGLSAFTTKDYFLFQDGGTLYKVNTTNWSTTALVSGLNAAAKIKYLNYANQIWFTNGLVTGRVDSSGNYKNWGCATATATAVSTAGDLPAGRYMVAATFVDSSGIEHSADKAAVITLNGTQDITANVTSVDANATHVKFYITEPNGEDLFFTKQVAVGALPTTITDANYSEEFLRTQHLSPPIAGDGLFAYNGMIIIYAENYLFPSLGANHHLYEISETIEARPRNILAGAGLNTGFWTVCDKGAYWTTGNVPEDWTTKEKDSRKYAKGSLVLPGYLIPGGDLGSDLVALFVSEDGLIVGLPSGELKPLMKERIKLDVSGKEASIVYNETSDLKQILFSLE